MPFVPPPAPLPGEAPVSAAVLELPLGNVGSDIAAVYRSISHGRHVVNGYSGYEAPHYRPLKTGLGERDDSTLTMLTRHAPIVVAIAKEDDPGGGLGAFAGGHVNAVRIGETAERTVYLLPQPAAEGSADQMAGAPLPVQRIEFNLGAFDFKAVTDGDPETVWATPMPQRGGEQLDIDLGAVRRLSGVSLSTGPALEGYARALAVTTSIDGENWQNAWSGGMAGAAVEGALRDPQMAEARIAFPARPARYVRLRQLGAHPDFGWFIAELKVLGSE
jgi:hypothetical protein